MSRLWTTVATLLWIAISVSGQCKTSKERNAAKKSAELTSRNVRDGAAVFSTIGAGAALASGVGAPLAPVFAAVGPIVSFITGIVEEAGPTESDYAIDCMNAQFANMSGKLDDLKAQQDIMKAQLDNIDSKLENITEQLNNITKQIEDLQKDMDEVKETLGVISTAIGDLKDFMSDKFADLQFQIDASVTEIEAHRTASRWKEAVFLPMMELRDPGKALLDYNYSRDALDEMAAACGDEKSYKPYNIANALWALAGDACKPNHRKLKARKSETNGGIPHTCMGIYYTANAGYAHAAAENAHNLIMNAWVELLFYHSVCVGLVYKRAGRVEIKDKLVKDKLTLIWNESPKIIRETAELYWPDHALKYAKTFIIGDGPEPIAEKIYKALNKRFSWYKHRAISLYCRDDHKTDYEIQHTVAVLDTIQSSFLDIENTMQNKDVNGRILITRYRNVTHQDSVDASDRRLNLAVWLRPGTVREYVMSALERDNNELWTSLSEKLDSEEFGGKTEDSRNHGFVMAECSFKDNEKRIVLKGYGDNVCIRDQSCELIYNTVERSSDAMREPIHEPTNKGVIFFL